MKILKVVIILSLSIIMGVIVLFLGEASVIDAIALSFFAAIHAFLGIDLAGMIKETRLMPAGDQAGINYKEMHMYRYVIVMFIMGVLSLLSVYVYKVYQINCIAAMSLFGSGVMITGGMVLGGLQANKSAAWDGPK